MSVGTGTALLGSAAASTGSGLLSSIFGNSSAKSYASAAYTASKNSMLQYYDNQTRLEPWTNAGTAATFALEKLFTGNNGQADIAAMNSALEQTPGYQFSLDQGLKSTQNSAAARGLGVSGAALKGAANYSTGLADQTIQTNLINPLEYLSNLGENASAQVGTSGANAVNSSNSSLLSGATATSAGTSNTGSSFSNAVSGIGSNLTTYSLLKNLTGSNSGGTTTTTTSGF